VGRVAHVRFIVFQAVHNAFKLLILIEKDIFLHLAYLEKGWTGVLLMIISA
jgi:hypothetical protein